MIAEFTTLIGLIATFKQLRDGRKNKVEADIQSEFLEWLVSREFEGLSRDISQSSERSAQIAEILKLETSQILSQLATIEDVVLSISQKMNDFGELASSFPETETFSEQAISLLQTLDNTELGKGVLFEDGHKHFLMILPHGNGQIEPSEPRFFLDDLKELLSVGWLSVVDYTDRGSPIYQVTRPGSRAARNLQPK